MNGEPKIRITRTALGADSLNRKEGPLPAPAPAPAPRDDSSKPPSSISITPEDALGLWEDRTLSNIFKITVDSDRRHDSHGQELIYLPGTRADLEENGCPVRLNVSVLDQALLEAATGLPDKKPLDYLLPCWKRVSKAIRSVKSTNRDDPKFQVLQEARRLCMSYCAFAITLPEIFGYFNPFPEPNFQLTKTD